jgi:uncharacterized protein (TIGR00251 family)
MTGELSLDETSEGVLLSIRAQPRARKSAITGIHAGSLKVAVTAAPEKGKANDAILKLLAQALGLRGAQLTIASGASSSQKRVLVTGISAAELTQRVAHLLAEQD